ncbi:MAG: hypothetical protein V4527_18130 [Pseudomonadota bacterium]
MATPLPIERDERNRFIPGNNGGPGRPKGARNKLGEAFIEALHDDFKEHGVAAIVKVRDEKPDQYLKVIASLLPKELTLNFGDERGELTDDELIERIRALTETVTPLLAGGAGRSSDAACDPPGAEKPARVH